MGKSKDLATGETRFVNTAGDTMTGDLGIGVAPAQPLHVFKAGSQGGGLAPLIKVQNDTNNLTGDGSGIEFHGKYQGGEWGFGKIGGTNSGSNFGGALEFHTNTGTGSVSTGFTKKMTIDRSGHVTMPNQPAFYAVTNSTAQTSDGTVVFQSESLDVASSYNNSTGVFTAPVAGIYEFHVYILVRCASSTSYAGCWLQKNGNRVSAEHYQQNNSSRAHDAISFSHIESMAANDTANVYIILRNSADKYPGPYSSFGGRLVS